MPDPHARPPATQWPVRVRDAADRDRTLTVITRGTRAAVVLPPGEGCSMGLDQVRQLDAVLAAAAGIADREIDRREPTGHTTDRRAGEKPHHSNTPGLAATNTEAGTPGRPGLSGETPPCKPTRP